MSPVERSLTPPNQSAAFIQSAKRIRVWSSAEAKKGLMADSVELTKRMPANLELIPPKKNWKQQLEARFLLKTEDVKRYWGDVKLCNLHYVDRYLIRGAMPESEAEFKKLKDYHKVDTIIDLRGPETTRPEYLAYEKNMAQKHGLKYHYIPLESEQPPSLEALMVFINVMRETVQNNGRVFIHCKHGIDRTGSIVVAYEMFFKSIPVEKALEGMKRHGYNWIHQWQKPAQEAFIKSGQMEWLLGNLRHSDEMERFAPSRLSRRRSI